MTTKQKLTITLFEAKAEKEAAEETILRCIEDFEAATHLSVEDLFYWRIDPIGCGDAPSPPWKRKITLRIEDPFA